jgi:hypothetical protein
MNASEVGVLHKYIYIYIYIYIRVGDQYSKLPPVASRPGYPTRSNTTPRFDLSATGVIVPTLPIDAVPATM